MLFICDKPQASNGETEFQALLLCSDQSLGFPMPSAPACKTLAQYGNFEVYVMNGEREHKVGFVPSFFVTSFFVSRSTLFFSSSCTPPFE